MNGWTRRHLLSLGLTAIALPASASASAVAAERAWHDVGPTLDDNYLSRSPSVAIAKRQEPVVAYVRTTPQSDGRQVGNIFVERWNGADWQPLGAAVNTKRRFAAELPSLVVDAQDRPVAAWYEAQNEVSSRFAVYVKRWNGSAWEPLGGALNSDLRRSALSPSLALGPDQQPVVALAEAGTGGLLVRVRRWDGAQWQLVGGPVDIGLGAETQVAVDGAGRISVAFTREVAFSLRQVFVVRWDGVQWAPLGGTVNRDATRPSASPSLAVAPDGRVSIAWQEQVENANKVYTSQWDDATAAWVPLGGALDGGVAARSTVLPRLALLRTGEPVAAWTDASTFQTHVHRWTGVAWRALGDNPVIDTSQQGYDLAVDGKNRPVLAFGQKRSIFDGDVRVRRFGS